MLIGIEYFLIYDNNSSDNLEASLLPFVKANFVQHVQWNGSIGIAAQQEAYRDAISITKSENISWVAMLDTDEFIFPLRDQCLPKFLSRFDGDDYTAGIGINWRMVSSKNQLSNRIVPYQTIFERTDFSPGYPDRHIKTIFRPFRTEGLLTAHAARYMNDRGAVSVDSKRRINDSFNNPPEIQDAVILHYHIKSLEEWVSKKIRWRDGMNAKRCPACHMSLDGIVEDWLVSKKSQNKIYRHHQTRSNTTIDNRTVEFMRIHSDLMKKILR
jgi:hypothetical protein